MMEETKCKDCKEPRPVVHTKHTACRSTHHFTHRDGLPRTEFVVAGYGNVPVLQGDPKWIPDKCRSFICEKVHLMRPANIFICNGSVFEQQMMIDILLKKGSMEKLENDVYLVRTDPLDTARVEKNTYIVTSRRDEVEAERRGATSECELAHWMSRQTAATELDKRFPGCMRGRTMYVIPFSMGPIAGANSKNAVQLTDSPYVVLNMRVVARVSSSVWDSIGTSQFVRCVHSMGTPRPVMREIVKGWPCNTSKVLILHYLPENEVWSFGSGYGGNSLLGKKCLALRIGSYCGWKEGWLAEHAAIVSVTDPAGKETFILASFPSGAGKTVLATMVPALPGWTVRLLGDDIAWIRFDSDGQMYAMAPENGMFGIAADTRPDTGANIVKLVSKDALLVNAASTSKGRAFWQGMEETLLEGEKVTDWRGNQWTKESKNPPAHPNCRFTVYTSNASNVHPQWDSPKGVPISAILYGARRPDEMPLVLESRNWADGVTLAAGMRTLVGSVSDKKCDVLVHDPMSMRPFMSYSFPKYVEHWLGMETAGRKMPKMFHVNWYQPDADGKPIWPGYGNNIRVIEWMLARVNSSDCTGAVETPMGFVPQKLNMEGLCCDIGPLIKVEKPFWEKELDEMKRYFDVEMGDLKPAALQNALCGMIERVKAMP